MLNGEKLIIALKDLLIKWIIISKKNSEAIQNVYCRVFYLQLEASVKMKLQIWLQIRLNWVVSEGQSHT